MFLVHFKRFEHNPSRNTKKLQGVADEKKHQRHTSQVHYEALNGQRSIHGRSQLFTRTLDTSCLTSSCLFPLQNKALDLLLTFKFSSLFRFVTCHMLSHVVTNVGALFYHVPFISVPSVPIEFHLCGVFACRVYFINIRYFTTQFLSWPCHLPPLFPRSLFVQPGQGLMFPIVFDHIILYTSSFTYTHSTSKAKPTLGTTLSTLPFQISLPLRQRWGFDHSVRRSISTLEHWLKKTFLDSRSWKHPRKTCHLSNWPKNIEKTWSVCAMPSCINSKSFALQILRLLLKHPIY